MKTYRIIVLIMLILYAVIGTGFASDPYKNNPDYKMVLDCGNGEINYLDKKTVKVKKYAPPIYEIEFKILKYKQGESKVIRYTYETRYNYETKQIWNMNDGKYNESNVYIYWRYSIYADEAFKIAYGIPFYNQIENGRISLFGLSPLRGNFQRIMQKLEEIKRSQPLGYVEKTKVLPGGVTAWVYHDKMKTIHLFFGNEDSLIFIGTHGAAGAVTPDGVGIGATGEEVIEKYGVICALDTVPLGEASYHYSSADGCHIIFGTKNNEVRIIQVWWQEP